MSDVTRLVSFAALHRRCQGTGELFNRFFDPAGAWEMLSRYAHVPGITWIGLLYFFNRADAGLRRDVRRGADRGPAQDHVAGAVVVPLGGPGHVPVRAVDHRRAGRHGQLLLGQRGTAILTGMLLGVTMFLNVGAWRAQKVIIGSAERVAQGGEADPRAASLAKPAARAARQHPLQHPDAVLHGVCRPRPRVLGGRSTAPSSTGSSSC